MKILNYLEEYDVPISQIGFMTALSGMANAMILVIINTAAEMVSNDNLQTQYFLLYIIVFVLYVYTQRYALSQTEVAIEKFIRKVRVRIADKIRSAELHFIEHRDWVKLAVNRAQITGWKTIFWLDEDREHHIELRKKVEEYFKYYDISGLDIEIMSVKDAAKVSIERIRAGENTISVTGNVLRYYNTDLSPIFEVGASAKMLSIVPLMAGDGLFETGAGGSAPKHVQQLLKDNYLRWDSLGEFLALVPSLEQVAAFDNNVRAKILANALDKATEKLLENNKSPQRKLGTIDNRGSHFYLAMYWAEALAKQTEDAELASKFAKVFKNLAENEETINQELLSVQKQAVDLGGYYKPDFEKISAVMKPSKTFNDIINNI